MTKQGAGSTPSLPATDLGNTAGWGGKRTNPWLPCHLDHGYPANTMKKKAVVTNSIKSMTAFTTWFVKDVCRRFAGCKRLDFFPVVDLKFDIEAIADIYNILMTSPRSLSTTNINDNSILSLPLNLLYKTSKDLTKNYTNPLSTSRVFSFIKMRQSNNEVPKIFSWTPG